MFEKSCQGAVISKTERSALSLPQYGNMGKDEVKCSEGGTSIKPGLSKELYDLQRHNRAGGSVHGSTCIIKAIE